MSFLLRNIGRFAVQKLASDPRAREKAAEVASAVVKEARQIAREEEISKQKRKLWVGIFFTVFIMYMSHKRILLLLSAEGLSLDMWVYDPWLNVILLVLATPVCVWSIAISET